MTLKLRAKVNFPATVNGSGGIAVEKTNGMWVVKPDFGSLTTLDAIPSPENRQLWIYTPSTGVYNTVTFATLSDALNSIPIGTDLDLDGNKITNLGDGTDDGDAINKGQADAAYQPIDATLTSLSGLGTAANKIAVTTGVDTWEESDVTAAGLALIDDADPAAQRATLELGTAAQSDTGDFATAAQGATVDSALQPGDIGSTVQAYDSALSDIAGITFAQGDVLYFNGTNIVNLGPGTDGQFLKTQGPGANPAWTTIPGGGDMLSSNNLSDVADAATAFGNIKQAATTSATGAVEKATDAEVRSAAADKFIDGALIESASASVALTDAATVAVDWDSGINFTLTVTASRAIGNPTNGQPGTYRSILVQGSDGTDRAITFDTNFLGDVPTITDCDSGKWYLLTLYCISTSHFLVSSKVAKQ